MNKDVEEINKIFEKFELLDKDNNYIDKLDISENKIKILGIDFKNYEKIIRLYEKLLLKNSELNFLIMRSDIFNELKY